MPKTLAIFLTGMEKIFLISFILSVFKTYRHSFIRLSIFFRYLTTFFLWAFWFLFILFKKYPSLNLNCFKSKFNSIRTLFGIISLSLSLLLLVLTNFFILLNLGSSSSTMSSLNLIKLSEPKILNLLLIFFLFLFLIIKA